MKLHGKIQEKIAKEYTEKGYTTHTEASIPYGEGRFFIVDVLAIKDKENIAIEIGRTQNYKIEKLKELGFKTRNISFHTIKEDGNIECICGHKWKPRTPKPLACPNCKQYLYWKKVEQ